MHKLVFGLLLVGFGIVAFLGTVDLWNSWMPFGLLPLALVALGLASEADAFRARRSSGGAILVAIGVWLLIGNHDLFGLSHRTAFPVAVAVVGLFMTLHALVDRPAAVQTKENEHEPC